MKITMNIEGDAEELRRFTDYLQNYEDIEEEIEDEDFENFDEEIEEDEDILEPIEDEPLTPSTLPKKGLFNKMMNNKKVEASKPDPRMIKADDNNDQFAKFKRPKK